MKYILILLFCIFSYVFFAILMYIQHFLIIKIAKGNYYEIIDKIESLFLFKNKILGEVFRKSEKIITFGNYSCSWNVIKYYFSKGIEKYPKISKHIKTFRMCFIISSVFFIIFTLLFIVLFLLTLTGKIVE